MSSRHLKISLLAMLALTSPSSGLAPDAEISLFVPHGASLESVPRALQEELRFIREEQDGTGMSSSIN